MGEVWCAVDGWPYEVSSHGRVRRSVAGGSPIAKVGRLLRPASDKDGYACVTLCDKPRMQTFKVHSLVCAAFHGPAPPDTDQVRHLDGTTDNNVPSNLRWGTALDNAKDRKRHGTHGSGERSARAKLTQAQADGLRLAYGTAIAGRQRAPRGWRHRIAALYGVSPETISCIVQGRGYN
jgi:hypothetical protein